MAETFHAFAVVGVVKTAAKLASSPGSVRCENFRARLVRAENRNVVAPQIPLVDRIPRTFGGDTETLFRKFERGLHFQTFRNVFGDCDQMRRIALRVANRANEDGLPEQLAALFCASNNALPLAQLNGPVNFLEMLGRHCGGQLPRVMAFQFFKRETGGLGQAGIDTILDFVLQVRNQDADGALFHGALERMRRRSSVCLRSVISSRAAPSRA